LLHHGLRLRGARRAGHLHGDGAALVVRMADCGLTDTELTSLADTHDIISLGVLADDLRRQRHGTKTTFVRVADVAAEAGTPVVRPAAAGELRIQGVAASRAAAVERIAEVAAVAGAAAVSAFS